MRSSWIARDLKVLDVTDLAHPQVVPGATLPLADARNVTVSRTYAYVSAGSNGIDLVNVDAARTSAPRSDIHRRRRNK